MYLLKVYKLDNTTTFDGSIELIAFTPFASSKYINCCYYIRFYYHSLVFNDPKISLHLSHRSVGSNWGLFNENKLFSKFLKIV